MRFNEGVFDSHVHTHGGCGVDNYLRNGLDNLTASGLDGMNLLCVRIGKSVCMTDTEALLLKAIYPDKFTVYSDGCYDIPEFGVTPDDFRNQIQDFIDAGADGLKMGDGELGPGVPLDDPRVDPMFDLIEETGFPVIYHVGSAVYMPPRRRFQKNKEGVLARFLGYDPIKDEDLPENAGVHRTREELEEQRSQIENLLKRHPRAKITFPHMYFMSDDLGRLADFLNRHPYVNVDITPCPEIYYHLSKDPGRTREFFVEYQDRLIFGTDNTLELSPIEGISNIRRFLESDETFFVPQYGFDITGIAPLPPEVLRKIYRENFLRICDPKPFAPKKAAEYCDKLYETVRHFEELPEDNKEDILEVARRLRAL